MDRTLYTAYKAYRKGPKGLKIPPQKALLEARKALLEGKKFWGGSTTDFGPGTWQVEDAERIKSEPPLISLVRSLKTRKFFALHDNTGQGAFRLVGKVMPNDSRNSSPWQNYKNDNYGYYTEPYGEYGKDGSGLCWGVVYQVPGKNRYSRFVAGYEFGGIDQGITLDLGEVFQSIDSRTDPHEQYAARAAARYADELAKHAAEKEREYQTAYHAGSRWRDLADEISDNRKEALKLLAECRKARLSVPSTLYPTIREVLKEKISSLCTEIYNMREKQEVLTDGDHEELHFHSGNNNHREAFNDGAGCKVFK